MGAREFLQRDEAMTFEAESGMALKVASGIVSLTRHHVVRDYVLEPGDGLTLRGTGTAVATACRPAMLELYRRNQSGVREAVQRSAHRQRNDEIWAFLRRLFA